MSEMSAEEASALATRAFCADLEYWASSVQRDGYVGYLELVRFLDDVRETTEPYIRPSAWGGEGRQTA